jgi:hypothetical protein
MRMLLMTDDPRKTQRRRNKFWRQIPGQSGHSSAQPLTAGLCQHQTYGDSTGKPERYHKPTSLERPETNKLSVGAHPRDGESVEAKGMPTVK